MKVPRGYEDVCVDLANKVQSPSASGKYIQPLSCTCDVGIPIQFFPIHQAHLILVIK